MNERLTRNRPVLVTGASSGIGRMVTEYLAREGHLVYACARKERDIESLNSLDNVISFRLDVTRPAEVQQVVERVKKEGKGLRAIVNNAGVVDFWPIAVTTEKMLHRVFDVNVYGPLRVTNALISFLIESKGRIVNISSASGIVTRPSSGAYGMSKHAFEEWSDVLSLELKEHGVKVSIIEPTRFKSDIVQTALAIIQERSQQPVNPLFRSDVEAIFNSESQNLAFASFFENLPAPEKVADAAMDALFSDRPRARYFVTPEHSAHVQALKSLLMKVAQVFQDNEHDISKKDLYDFLDEALDEVSKP